MTVSTGPGTSNTVKLVTARMGYGVTILVDLVLLWVVDNLLAWEVVPFLTEDFSQVSGLIMFSLLASLFVNASLLVADNPRSGTIEKAALALINLWVAVRLLRVFPFDFSGSDVWAIAVRVILVVAILGAFADFVAGVARLARLQRR